MSSEPITDRVTMPSWPRVRAVVDRAGPWVMFVVIGVAAFSAGHFMGPERVETQLVEVTRVKWRERWHRAAAKKTSIVAEVKPDGSSKTTTVIDEKSDEGSEKAGESLLEHREATLTVNRPDWRASVHLGASLVKPFVPLGDTPIIIQACLDRRIIGGVSAGACVSTVGAATLGVSVEF